MATSELQKQTNINIQEKANLIWKIATHLVGLYKPHEYGKVILPMTVLKRFDDALKTNKQAVVEMFDKLNTQKVEGTIREGILPQPLILTARQIKSDMKCRLRAYSISLSRRQNQKIFSTR